MHTPFRNGTAVRQSVPVITGTVVDGQYDSEKGRFRYRVNYAEADGSVHERWFDQDELVKDEGEAK